MSILTDPTVKSGSSDEVSMPGILSGLASMGKESGIDMSQYKVRVDRFVIDADGEDTFRLETLYTRGMDGSGNVVILKEKTFTDKEAMITVITYMEKKLREDPVSAVGQALSPNQTEV